MNGNCLDIFVSDTYTPLTAGMDVVGLTDEIRVDDQKVFVSAYIERDGHLLVESIEDEMYVLPRDVISKGETPQDALFRVLRTKYGIEATIGASINLRDLALPILHISDKCYKVTIIDSGNQENLKWVDLVDES